MIHLKAEEGEKTEHHRGLPVCTILTILLFRGWVGRKLFTKKVFNNYNLYFLDQPYLAPPHRELEENVIAPAALLRCLKAA